MEECIFCKIASGEIKSDLIYEDERLVAFNDINPQAPVHILIIPRDHVETVTDISQGNKDLVSDMVLLANRLAKKGGVWDSGFRLVLNCRSDAGQEVFHLHLHLLGGRKMSWPPG